MPWKPQAPAKRYPIESLESYCKRPATRLMENPKIRRRAPKNRLSAHNRQICRIMRGYGGCNEFWRLSRGLAYVRNRFGGVRAGPARRFARTTTPAKKWGP